MHLITHLDELLKNISEFEKGFLSSSSDTTKYRSLVKRGTCFVPFRTDDGIGFAPSRFVGYIENNLESHADNQERDGRETNEAISEVLGMKPEIDDSLEQHYLAFCGKIGIEPSKTGSFGAPRKFWNLIDRKDTL